MQYYWKLYCLDKQFNVVQNINLCLIIKTKNESTLHAVRDKAGSTRSLMPSFIENRKTLYNYFYRINDNFWKFILLLYQADFVSVSTWFACWREIHENTFRGCPYMMSNIFSIFLTPLYIKVSLFNVPPPPIPFVTCHDIICIHIFGVQKRISTL